MDEFESQLYRNKLASEINLSPKGLRKSILEQAKSSEEYIRAWWEHNKQKREQEPKLEFDLDNLEDLKEKLNLVAKYIYNTITVYDEEGGYNPYKGHNLCGEVTKRFIVYLETRGIQAKKIHRAYKIKTSNSDDINVFGHVYLTIDREEDRTIVDPTYLQWIDEEARGGLPSVLVIRYKDEEDLRRQFTNVPIKNGLVIPFYFGLDSQEAKEFFKDSRYTVESEEIAEVDEKGS